MAKFNLETGIEYLLRHAPAKRTDDVKEKQYAVAMKIGEGLVKEELQPEFAYEMAQRKQSAHNFDTEDMFTIYAQTIARFIPQYAGKRPALPGLPPVNAEKSVYVAPKRYQTQ